ncbi:hypothetical protein [Corallococcus sp. EGB]|uniref:WapI family immunity protein n=1 Tax=Corallococcus sp. EGB TaxID=1521117 RepID=UPI001CBF4641|nr:hypothetical protein [Corallococcus sp. EGB]
MLFENKRGERFALRLVGYQFPDGDDALNWLNIEIDAVFASVAWRATDPALETFEVAALADWLEGLAAEAPTQESLHFTEPNLVFKRLAGDGREVHVRVQVRGELRPRPAIDSFGAKVHADFALDAVALRRASGSLRVQLQRFPPRDEPDPDT